MLGEMKQMLMLAEEMTSSYVAAVVITGLVVVFSALLILVALLYLMGAIFHRKKKPADAAKPASTAKPSPAAGATIIKASDAAVVEQNGLSEEIVAAISAAVAMISESSGKKLLIKSISRSGNSRSSWAQAGKIDNTRPF